MIFLKKIITFSLMFIMLMFVFQIQTTFADDNLPTPEPTVEKFNAKAGTYELINPIGNISSIKDQDPGGLSNFFNLLIKIAIALAGAMAVVVIIINGIQYMGTDSVWEKGETRFKIGAAIGGLILLLTSYIILFTINPDLVNIKIGITKGTEGEWDLSIASNYRLAETRGGDQNFRKNDNYYDKIKKFVNDTNYTSYGYTNKINHCMAQVAVQRETNYNPNLIGHDENAASSSIPSRVSFIKSGKKESGTTLTSSDTITNKKTFNDDHNESSSIFSADDLNATGLGLDWRFSHGIGLMQVTFYPETSSVRPYNGKNNKTEITGTIITPKTMLNIDTALAAGVEHLQKEFKHCNGDVLNTYKAYSGGGCYSKNADSIAEATLRKKLYDECIAQDK